MTGTDARDDVVERKDALSAAAHFLALFMLHAFLIRIADVVDLARADALAFHPLAPPFSVPFILGQELIVALALASVLAWVWRWRAARVAWVLALGLYLAWLAADQAAFGYFFSHVDHVLFSETHDLQNLSSSIAQALDPAFFGLVAYAIAVPALLLSSLRFVPMTRALERARRRPVRWLAAATAYVVLSFALDTAHDQQGLAASFPATYVSSYLDHIIEERALEAAMAHDAPPVPDATSTADGGVARSADRSGEGGARRLNVVVYLMESTSYRETSMFPGAPYDTTPFLASLAKRSLFFDNYYAIVAASTRSFFSLLTGVYPYMDRASDLTRYSQIRIPSLPDVLHDEGYATAFFASSDSMFEGLDTFLAARAFDEYVDKNLLAPGEAPAGSTYWGVDEEIMIDKALDWIAQVEASGRPFYLSYNAVFPHHPFRVPAGHEDLEARDWGDEETRARFRASLAYADRSVERMYDGLERMGLLDDTLFIVTPDHGETFGDLHRKNFIHAEYCYDEDSRIFLIAHNPSALGPPEARSALGSHMDLFPTVLDILGIERELEIDGASLLDGPPPARLFHFSRRQMAVREGGMKLIVPREGGGGRRELYDLRADPDEQANLAEARPDDVERLSRMIEGWRLDVAKAFRGRLARSGTDDREISGIAQQRRARMFERTQVKIGSFTVCPGAGNTACAPATSGSVARGQPLTVRAVLAKPADGRVKVEIYDQSGRRAFAQIEDLRDRREAVFSAVPTDALELGATYRLRVSTVYYRAVHDSRWFKLTVR